MSTLRAAFAVAAKDLRIYARDRVGMLLGFALPAALVLVFGFIMTFVMGSDGVMGRAELWVADLDGSERSRAFVADLRAAQTLRVRPRLAEDGSPAETAPDAERARAMIRDGDAHHVLVIGAGFGAAIAEGADPPLDLLRDPGREMEDQLVRIGLVGAWLQQTEGRGWIAMLDRQMRESGMSEPMLESLRRISEQQYELIRGHVEASEAAGEDDGADAFDFGAAMDALVPLRADEEIAPPERAEDVGFMQAQAVGGIAVMMLMFGMVACGSTLLRERETGTLRRLLASPMPPSGLLLGKFLFTFAVGILQLLLLFLLGEVAFGIGVFRDPLTLLIHSVAVAAAVTSFGLLVAAWARTVKQAEGVSTLAILVMSCLGGSWFPLQAFALPAPVELAMKSTLTHWAVSGYQGIFWHGLAWTDPAMLRKLAVLLGFALVAGWTARALFQKRYLGRR
jgi:ABC-2 type transport system permease protein